MKSIQINRYGGSDVIEVENSASAPTPSSGKILVNVKAAGVNPADWKIREGYFQQMAPLQFPSTLGADFSGVIKQLGEGVSNSGLKREMKYTDKPQPSSAVAREHLQNWLW